MPDHRRTRRQSVGKLSAQESVDGEPGDLAGEIQIALSSAEMAKLAIPP